MVHWFLDCFGDKDAKAGERVLIPTTSASGRQVQILWREISGVASQAKTREHLECLTQKLRLKDCPEAMAEGFKAANEKVVEGRHSEKMLYVLTEARGAEDWAFTAILKACTGRDNRVLVQSVPGTEEGEFYAIASGQRGVYSPALNPGGWRIFVLPAARKDKETGKYLATCPHVTQESIDEKLRYGEDSEQFVGPVLAEFIPGSPLTLVSLGEYLRAWDRWAETDVSEDGPDILGIDVAWVGQNDTVFTHRKGDRVIRQWGYQGVRTTETARVAKEWYGKHGGYICIESVGVSAGVIDIILADQVPNLIEVYPGNPAIEVNRFKDRRSELYYYLAQRFKEGRIAVPERDSPLCGQLTSIKKMVRGDEVFQLEPKGQAFKSKGSPDWADSLMLTLAAPTEPAGSIRFQDLWSGGERVQPDW